MARSSRSEILGYDYYRRTAQAAERGKFDLLFVGDMLAAREKDGRVIAQGALNNIEFDLDPAAVAGATERVGLVATLSTTYNEPFAIAERFASLDHISGGRAGWNIITTANDDAASTSAASRTWKRRCATSAPRSSSISARACGTAGKTAPSRPTARAACSSIRARCTSSTTRASSSR